MNVRSQHDFVSYNFSSIPLQIDTFPCCSPHFSTLHRAIEFPSFNARKNIKIAVFCCGESSFLVDNNNNKNAKLISFETFLFASSWVQWFLFIFVYFCCTKLNLIKSKTVDFTSIHLQWRKCLITNRDKMLEKCRKWVFFIVGGCWLMLQLRNHLTADDFYGISEKKHRST